MKKYFNLLVVCVATMTTILTSCQVDEEPVYSCNDSVNAWVKTNVSMIRQMNRKTWLTYPDSLSIPIYRAFTPEQKQQIWLGKMEQVLNHKDWTDKEKEHLLKLANEIQRQTVWFADESIENNDEAYEEYQLFFYKWLKYATEELQWNKEMILAIAFTGKDLAENYSQAQTKATIPGKDHTEPDPDVDIADCDCKIGNVLFTTCAPPYYCEKIICKGSNHGCGAVWVESCNGLCI